MRFSSLLLPLFAASSLAARSQILKQFANPTWLENIAPTCNGSLLVSVLGRGELYLVKPSSPFSTPSLVATFPSKNAVLGIAELEPDLFAVGVGSTTPDQQPVPQSYSVYTVDLLPRDRPAKVQKIADLPNVTLINGVVALNPYTLLLADSFQGNIVKLDVKTKQYSVALQDPTLASNFSAQLPLGVNGIRLVRDTLYYSNTVQSLVGRVKLDKRTGSAVGKFQVIAQGNGIAQPDDFAVAADGSLYVTSPVSDSLLRVRPNGKVDLIKQGGDVAGATSATFLRSQRTLYLATSGLVGGVPTQGGKIVMVNL